MSLFAFAATLGCLGFQAEPIITPVEAASAARWFCDCVDIKPCPQPVSVVLRERSKRASTPADYVMDFCASMRSVDFSVHVDAVSGDVTLMQRLHVGIITKTGNRTAPIKWLKRLGRFHDLIASSDPMRFNLGIEGRPFCNLNGSTSASFSLLGSKLVYYDGPGAAPPPPKQPRSISSSKAISLAKASKRLGKPISSTTVVPHTELVLFYAGPIQESRWLWKVDFDTRLNGHEFGSQTVYIDACSGKEVTDVEIQGARFGYHSRAPRAGLASIPNSFFAFPLLSDALKRLKEIGRPDFKFKDISVMDGLLLYGESAFQLKIARDGKLITFHAPLREGNHRRSLPRSVSRAMPLGQKLILAQVPTLSGGNFGIQPSYANGCSHVYYRQSAFGYRYLNEEAVSVDLNGAGEVVAFERAPESARPRSAPRRILAPNAIEKRAYAFAKPYIPEDGPGAQYTEMVKTGDLGWYVDPTSRKVTFAYMVSIGFPRNLPDHPSPELRFGLQYPFDAITGRCLSRFP